MQISKKGLSLLKEWEGCLLHIYKDSAGYPTIGVGHLISKGEDFSKGLTEQQASDLLAKDILPKANTVNTLVKVPLTQDQFDALVSFTFNVGSSAFKASTLLKKLNNKDYLSVPTELLKWTKAGGILNEGLVNRRNKEIKLWKGLI